MSEPIGSLLDSLGLAHAPDEGELATDAIVLLKVIDPDGRAVLRTVCSEGMSWIERVGMLRVAERVELDELNEGDA